MTDTRVAEEFAMKTGLTYEDALAILTSSNVHLDEDDWGDEDA